MYWLVLVNLRLAPLFRLRAPPLVTDKLPGFVVTVDDNEQEVLMVQFVEKEFQIPAFPTIYPFRQAGEA